MHLLLCSHHNPMYHWGFQETWYLFQRVFIHRVSVERAIFHSLIYLAVNRRCVSHAVRTVALEIAHVLPTSSVSSSRETPLERPLSGCSSCQSGKTLQQGWGMAPCCSSTLHPGTTALHIFERLLLPGHSSLRTLASSGLLRAVSERSLQGDGH